VTLPEEPSFEEDLREPASPQDALLLDLDGYEGPIDVLLSLAREQKVDLRRISILALADQYLAFIAEARQLRLEIAADYLVMAAWLAYLKSRLLLPEPETEGEPTGAELAAALAFQLQRLQAMREAGAKLMARPQLGRDFLPRGEPERFKVVARSVYAVTLYDLLKAYGSHSGRHREGALHILPSDLYSMDDALKRLGGMLGKITDWVTLASFLPTGLAGGLIRRSAVAATFAASLELARSGWLKLRQDRMFGPLYVKRQEDLPPG
jgi:segregation and condensation protein A